MLSVVRRQGHPLKQESKEAGVAFIPPWTDSIQKKLAGIVSGATLELHMVYMDVKRITGRNSFRLTEELLRRRYLASGLKFDT